MAIKCLDCGVFVKGDPRDHRCSTAQSRLNAMRTACVALDAAQCQPTVVAELIRCGLAEQFRLASELMHTETHAETMRLMEEQSMNDLVASGGIGDSP